MENLLKVWPIEWIVGKKLNDLFILFTFNFFYYRFNTNRNQAMRNSASPLYKGTLICDENLSISFWRKKMLQLDKNQWAIGFSVLDLSKLQMQKFFYDVIQPRFGVEETEVLMSDTDSFLLRLKTPLSGDECIEQLLDVMDTSNFPPSHRLFSNQNEKALGFLKDEVPCKKILSFVGLKSKTYAYQIEGGETQIKAKGIPHYKKKQIPFESMLNCLKHIQSFSTDYNTLRSVDHVNTMMHSSRVAFSSFDDKRYMLCPTHSVPYGSLFIPTSDNIYCYFCHNLKQPRVLTEYQIQQQQWEDYQQQQQQQQHHQQQQQQYDPSLLNPVIEQEINNDDALVNFIDTYLKDL